MLDICHSSRWSQYSENLYAATWTLVSTCGAEESKSHVHSISSDIFKYTCHSMRRVSFASETTLPALLLSPQLLRQENSSKVARSSFHRISSVWWRVLCPRRWRAVRDRFAEVSPRRSGTSFRPFLSVFFSRRRC